jgi:uncharacterized membrane protein
VKPILAATTTLLALDSLWLLVIAKPFYKARMGHLMAERTVWPAVGVVYLLLVAGLVLFVAPLARQQSLVRTVAFGASYGLIVYGVYDATNQATLAGWTTTLSLVDACWGAFVCGMAAAAMRAASS